MNNENKVIRIIYIVILSIAFLVLVSPFFIPLIFAGTIALTLYPVQLKLESIGMKRDHASALLTTLFTTFISIPLFYFIIKGTDAVTTQLEKMLFNEKLKDQGIQELVLDIRHDIVSAIKHPAASSGVLTALYNLLVFNQLSPQGGGELNPQRLKAHRSGSHLLVQIFSFGTGISGSRIEGILSGGST